MASRKQEPGPARADASGGDLSFASSLAFVSSMIGAASLARSEALAVYALSFCMGAYACVLYFAYAACPSRDEPPPALLRANSSEREASEPS